MTTDRELDQEEKLRLLAIARQTVADLVAGRRPAVLKLDLEGLSFRRGAFVTLHHRGNLRGCIGNFLSELPLAELVTEMAVAAASQDPRFPPVSQEEMPEIDFEISVLSPLRQVADPAEIEVGRDGIYLINPHGRGVLLPQVATEQGWDRQTFLEATCRKAGLGRGCWRDPATKVLAFTAQVFGEKDLAPA